MEHSPSTGTGFDRRSLIRKGLVAGGVAATLPVISTFNAPAFAASPGVYRIFFQVPLLGGNPQRIAPTGAGCAPPIWSAGTTLPDPGAAEIPITALTVSDPPIIVIPAAHVSFQLTGEGAAECTFTEVQASGLIGLCPPAEAIDTPTFVETDTEVLSGLLGRGYFVTVTCT